MSALRLLATRATAFLPSSKAYLVLHRRVLRQHVGVDDLEVQPAIEVSILVPENGI